MSLADERILVTGGAGFLGAATVRALVETGADVVVLDNMSRGRPDKLGSYRDRVRVIDGDVLDLTVIRKAVRGVHVVCHMAAINGTRYFYEIPDRVLEVGTIGTYNVLQACREEGIARFFFASSSEVYQEPPAVPTSEDVPLTIPDPFNPRYSYAGSKLIGELLTVNFARESFEAIMFRPHNIYGPDMGREHVIPEFALRLAGLAKQPGGEGKAMAFPIQGSGRETRAFCHVSDFVRGLLIVMEKGEDQNIYNIGVDHEIPIGDLAALMGRLAGMELQIVPGREMRGATPRRCPDIEKLRALGYAPEVSLEQGLRDVMDWYSQTSQE